MAKQLNVLCVTKRYLPEQAYTDEAVRCKFHLQIQGVVTVSDNLEIAYRQYRTNTYAEFDGRRYPIAWTRSGLDGRAFTIGIERRDEFPYTMWELYTDLPFPDYLGNAISQEELREWAKKYMPRTI